jgi:hypothetical protein
MRRLAVFGIFVLLMGGVVFLYTISSSPRRMERVRVVGGTQSPVLLELSSYRYNFRDNCFELVLTSISDSSFKDCQLAVGMKLATVPEYAYVAGTPSGKPTRFELLPKVPMKIAFDSTDSPHWLMNLNAKELPHDTLPRYFSLLTSTRRIDWELISD